MKTAKNSTRLLFDISIFPHYSDREMVSGREFPHRIMDSVFLTGYYNNRTCKATMTLKGRNGRNVLQHQTRGEMLYYSPIIQEDKTLWNEHDVNC